MSSFQEPLDLLLTPWGSGKVSFIEWSPNFRSTFLAYLVYSEILSFNSTVHVDVILMHVATLPVARCLIIQP